MKKNLNFYIRIIAVVLTLSTPLTLLGQQVNAIQNQSNLSEYTFRVDNYTPSNNGVVLSHLWWFGDNGYSFLANPTYTFLNNTGKMPSVVMTEGYGTAGPPPLRLTSSINSPVPATPLRSLSPGSFIRIQNYRKAVVKDTVYFIVTYAKPKNSNFSDGTVNIKIDNATNYLDAFVADNKDFLPNRENATLNSNDPTEIDVTFTNLDSTERSILIPVYVNINNKRNLNFTASISFEASKEVYRDNVSLPMRHSQDPNQMTEVSFSDDNNNGDIYTPCEFGGEKIDYTIDFQNIGEGETYYIQVVCQLDDKVDLSTIRDIIPPSKYSSIPEVTQPQMPNSNEANYYINHADKTITFEFQDLKLFGTGDPLLQNLDLSKSSVSFSINAKPDYVFGPAIISYSTIVFDENDALVTDTVFTQCNNPVHPGGFPTPDPTPTPSSPFPIKWILIGVGALALGFFAIKKLRK